jgi:hypothetical protein
MALSLSHIYFLHRMFTELHDLTKQEHCEHGKSIHLIHGLHNSKHSSKEFYLPHYDYEHDLF